MQTPLMDELIRPCASWESCTSSAPSPISGDPGGWCDGAEDVHDSHGAQDGLTRPLKASAFRKGGYILLKNYPCKIMRMTISKTGKHGHAKVKFVGIDIFTQRKHQELQASTHPMQEVIVTKADYFVADFDTKSGQLSLLDSNNEAYEFSLNPLHFTYTGSKDDAPIDFQVYKAYKTLPDGQELMISVTKAMGVEQIMSFKTVSESD